MPSVAFPIRFYAETVAAGFRLAATRQAGIFSGAPVTTPWPGGHRKPARRMPVEKDVENPEPDPVKSPNRPDPGLKHNMDADLEILSKEYVCALLTSACVAIAFLLVAGTCNWRHHKMYIRR